MSVATASDTVAAGRRWPRVLLWVAVALLVVFGALLVWAAAGEEVGEHRRSPEDPAPAGAMALAEVLRRQGVEVEVTRSLAATRAALGDGRDVTLLVDDDWWVLRAASYESLGPLAQHILLVQPMDDALTALAPEVEYAGFAGGEEIPADCELPAVQRAGTVSGGGDGYTAPADAIRCLGGEQNAALVRVVHGERTITVLGAGAVLTNARITEAGNAALALGLLGEQPRLVWYQPDRDDLALGDGTGLGELQADWYAPLVVLLLLVGAAAAVWRGRRMGPVVIEDLPVEVRASETMEGRARLYERSGAREHALATLRQATLRRLARTLGLGRTATPAEVVAATAAATGRDPAGLDALLRTTAAGDDRGFVRLSDALLELEHELSRAVRPG